MSDVLDEGLNYDLDMQHTAVTRGEKQQTIWVAISKRPIALNNTNTKHLYQERTVILNTNSSITSK
jgi:hypothetical protein